MSFSYYLFDSLLKDSIEEEYNKVDSKDDLMCPFRGPFARAFDLSSDNGCIVLGESHIPASIEFNFFICVADVRLFCNPILEKINFF